MQCNGIARSRKIVGIGCEFSFAVHVRLDNIRLLGKSIIPSIEIDKTEYKRYMNIVRQL